MVTKEFFFDVIDAMVGGSKLKTGSIVCPSGSTVPFNVALSEERKLGILLCKCDHYVYIFWSEQ